MRKTAFKIHSWLAIVFMLPLLLICITGSLLVFKVEIDGLLMPEATRLEHASGNRLDLDSLKNRINARFDQYEIGAWELFDDHQRADAVYFVKKGTQDWYKVYLNPYSGEILSTPVSVDSDFTDWLLDLHFTLLLDSPGMLLVFIFGIILVLLGVSGLIMYRQFYKRLFTLRWQKTWEVLSSDVHKMVGVFASPVLLILGITGVYWNLMAFIHEEFEHTPEQEAWVMGERMYSDDISLQYLLEDSQQQLDSFTPTYLLMPHEPDTKISIFGYVDTGNPFLSNYNSGVIYEPDSGEYSGLWDVRQATFGTKLIDSFRRLHFGTFGGLISRIIWCVLGAAPLILAISGFYLWWKRRSRRKTARRNRQAFASSGNSPSSPMA